MAYVAGPVLRKGHKADPWVEQCYVIIRQAARNAGQSALLPEAESFLELANAQGFSEEILSRIRKAGAVVAVFLPGDQSTPIECALAVREGKRVLILHQPGLTVPRLLAGLPGVETISFDPDGAQDLLSDIRSFLERPY
jgi:hypothetical protein